MAMNGPVIGEGTEEQSEMNEKIGRFVTSSRVSKMGDSFYFRIPKWRKDIHDLIGKELVLIIKLVEEVALAQESPGRNWDKQK